MQQLRRSGALATSPAPGRDVALALGLVAVGLVEAASVTAGERPIALAMVVPLATPLAWRRSRPSTVAVVVTAALVLQLPLAPLRLFDQTFTGFVCVLLALYALGRHGRSPRAVPVLVGCTLAVAGALGWYDQSVATSILGVVFVLAPAATGRVVAVRSELRELLDRQADRLRENAEVAERTRVAQVRGRIAGEVQDLVSGRVHEMVDRSRVARRLAQSDGRAAAELVATVEADGREALDEMRAMLGVLRTTELSGSTSPDPGADPSPDARHVSLPRAELLLATATAGLALGETLTAPGELPIVSLTVLPLVLAFCVGNRTSGRTAVFGLALALVGIAAVNLLLLDGRWGDYAFPSILVVLSWLGGRLVRDQNDLVQRSRRGAAALARSTEVRVAAAATEERLRLARELHDVLAHTLMVMVVQAGAARRSLENGRPGAEKALRVVEATGRDASTELRKLLALVDPQGDPTGDAVSGSLGSGDVRSLVDRARAAGLVVELVVDGEPVSIPSGMALAAYRVAQEAVTNVIRHADAGHLCLRLHYGPEQLRVEVRDDGRALLDAAGHTAGNGITGMRERAAIYGGELLAESSPQRGFVVTATFPLVQHRQEQPV